MSEAQVWKETIVSRPFCQVDEVVQATSVASGGAFRLSFDRKVAAPLAATASSLQVQQALEKLPTVGRMNVSDAAHRGAPLSEKRAQTGYERPRRPGVAHCV